MMELQILKAKEDNTKNMSNLLAYLNIANEKNKIMEEDIIKEKCDNNKAINVSN